MGEPCPAPLRVAMRSPLPFPCVPDRPYKILLAQVGTLSFSHPLFGVSVLFIYLENFDVLSSGVGVRNVILARGRFDKLEGPKYAARRADLRREAREAAIARDRSLSQAAAASQNEAEESDESEDETAGERQGERTTRVGRPRGGMKVALRELVRNCEER